MEVIPTLDWTQSHNLPVLWSLMPWFRITEFGCWEWIGDGPTLPDYHIVHRMQSGGEYVVHHTYCLSPDRFMVLCVNPDHLDKGGVDHTC